MRHTLILFALIVTVACSGSPSGPTSPGFGTAFDISGTWRGTFASTNNASEQITVNVTQSGSTINATWTGDAVAWSGNVAATLSGSSISGQLSFSGTVSDGTACTGTATITGSASSTAISLTSSGVTGTSCPAPLPTGVRIDLRK